MKNTTRFFAYVCMAFMLIAACSCSTMLDLWNDYDTCGLYGCTNKVKKGKTVCDQHDFGITGKSLDRTMEKVRKENRERLIKNRNQSK